MCEPCAWEGEPQTCTIHGKWARICSYQYDKQVDTLGNITMAELNWLKDCKKQGFDPVLEIQTLRSRLEAELAALREELKEAKEEKERLIAVIYKGFSPDLVAKKTAVDAELYLSEVRQLERDEVFTMEGQLHEAEAALSRYKEALEKIAAAETENYHNLYRLKEIARRVLSEDTKPEEQR